MTIHERALRDYQEGMKYQEIANKYKVSLSTVKSWKTRYKWQREKSTHTKSKVRKVGGQPRNINALGSKGPVGKANALKHGMFSKYLPKETLEIAMEIEDASPIDVLWMSIKLKFAAILRAQKLMYVENVEDSIKVSDQSLTVSTESGGGQRRTVTKNDKVISAVEREERFLKSQATAMMALTRMIKEYDELCRSSIATEEQLARIKKIRAEVDKMQGNTSGDDNISQTVHIYLPNNQREDKTNE